METETVNEQVGIGTHVAAAVGIICWDYEAGVETGVRGLLEVGGRQR